MADCGGAAYMILSDHPQNGADSNDKDEDEDAPLSTPGRRGSAGSESHGAAANPSITSGGTGGTPSSGSTPLVLRRPRGRPPGSKNKPKPAVVITRDSETAMRPVVLELSAGSDVLECVSSFARQRCLGVSVLSASGAVANVTLRHPTLHASTLTLHGRFDVLSLAGTFLPISTPTGGATTTTVATPLSSSSSSFSPSLSIVASAVKSPFTISLVGSQGQVIGEQWRGALIAAGPVVLVAASFASPEFHRLPRLPSEDEEAKPAMGSEQTGSAMVVHSASVGSGDGVAWRVPPEVLHWSSHPESAPAPHFRHSSHHLHHHY